MLINTKNINSIMSEYFKDSTLFLISLDVEGLDKQILKSFNFKKFRPIFFCVETAELSSEHFLGVKENELNTLMLMNGYEVYADTYINTIFIRKDILKQMY